MKKYNDYVKWIIVAFAIAGFIFNSGVLYNEVAHLKANQSKMATKEDIVEIRQDIKNINDRLWESKE